jgi:predicted metal-dependent hydrolase
MATEITPFTYKNLRVTRHYKPKLKHSYIQIRSVEDIVIKTPVKSLQFCYDLLEEKGLWIEKQLQKLRSYTPPKVQLQKEVLLFGKSISINTQEAFYLHNALKKLTQQSQKDIVACYDDFYLHMAKEYIPLRVTHFAHKMGLSYLEIRFKKMKSRWGSCSSSKVLTFNTQLIKVKKELIDYVVVHELAHLVHMNHSKAFHSLVESYLSNHKQLRVELKNYCI